MGLDEIPGAMQQLQQLLSRDQAIRQQRAQPPVDLRSQRPVPRRSKRARRPTSAKESIPPKQRPPQPKTRSGPAKIPATDSKVSARGFACACVIEAFADVFSPLGDVPPGHHQSPCPVEII